MTRGQLIFTVSRKLGLDDAAGSDELTLMQDWANRGVIDVLLKTHCYVDLGDMTLTSGQAEYRTDSNVLAVVGKRITSLSQRYSFEAVTMDEILELQNASPAGSSPARKIAIEGNLMIVWPTPSAADVIRWLYVPRPSSMTLDTHDPSSTQYGGIPTEYHDAIEYFMLWQGAEYDDKRAPLGPMDYAKLYENRCMEIRKRTRSKRARGLLPARVGYPGHQTAAERRNDVYP